MISCPIPNKEWNDLVQAVGELTAYSMYIENEYNIPDLNNLVKPKALTLEQEIKATSLRTINGRKNEIKFEITKFLQEHKNNKVGEAFLKRLNIALGEFEKESLKESLSNMVNFAVRTLNTLANRFEKENNDDIDLDFLREASILLDTIIPILNLDEETEALVELEENKDINTVDPKALQATIQSILDTSSFIGLNAAGDKYVDTRTGEEFERVTNVITEEKIKHPIKEKESIEDFSKRLDTLKLSDKEKRQALLIASSTRIGTKTDKVVRDFFNDDLKKLDHYELTDSDTFNHFIIQLERLKAEFDSKGLTVVKSEKEIVLHDTKMGVAGTVDLLVHDKKGNFYIYDMKTMNSDNFNQKYAGEKEVIYDTRFNGGKSKRQKHTEQLSVYRMMLKNTHGITAKGLFIIPIQITYNPGEEKTTMLKNLPLVELERNNTLQIGNKTLKIDHVAKSDETSGTDYSMPVPFFSEEYKNKFSYIKNKHAEFSRKVERLKLQQVVDYLAKSDKYYYDKYKFQAEKSFNKEFPIKSESRSEEERKEAKTEYVRNFLSLNRNEIYYKSKSRILKLIDGGQVDIDAIRANIDDPNYVKDGIINLVNNILQKVEIKIDNTFQVERVDNIRAFESFFKTNNPGVITNHRELYKDIYEEIDGKATGYFVSKTFSSVQEEFRQLCKDYANVIIDDPNLITRLKEFKSKYINESKLQKYEVKNEYFDFWKFKDYTHLEGFIKEEHINPQYTQLSGTKKDLHTHIVRFQANSDKLLGPSLRLFNKIPRLESGLTSKIQENGLKEGMSKAIAESTTTREIDSESTLDGKTKSVNIDRISLPLRHNLPVEDMSFDFATLTNLNRFYSRNYKEKRMVEPLLATVKEVMITRKVKKGVDLKQVYNHLIGEVKEVQDVYKEVGQSNSAQLIESILESRLYGYTNIDSGSMFGINIGKVASSLNSYSATMMLGLNIFGGVSNVLQGQVSSFLASAGGRFLDKKNFAEGMKTYLADTGGILKDFGQNVNTSKTNLYLQRLLGSSADFSSLSMTLTNDARFKEIISTKTLSFPNMSAEHFIQGSLMYALMDRMKKEGIDIEEMYDIVDGKLKVKRGKEFIYNEVEVALKLRAILHKIQGNYSSTIRTQIERYWYGKLALSMRRFMVGGFQSRYLGVTRVKKTFEETVEDDTAFYNTDLGEFDEGSYTSLIRFVYHSFKKTEALKATLTERWDDLTDMERSNIRQSMTELLVIASSLIASLILANLARGADDEDEKDRLFYLAYLSRRLSGEFIFYLPPFNVMEMLRVLSTPATSVNSLVLLSRVFGELIGIFNGLEEFESGRREGKDKLLHYIRQMVDPLNKNWSDRDVQEMYNFITGSRG